MWDDLLLLFVMTKRLFFWSRHFYIFKFQNYIYKLIKHKIIEDIKLGKTYAYIILIFINTIFRNNHW